ncbi:NADH-quinone oxidoreductase subunit C [Sporolituus thermophilus]|uniref:Ni,Fe-hydrogenase III large subunit n=1 Tax=Sporolituus thermophilus DSM 23256 TaxID=1123285 RepID=A0A1G7IRI8_9FIRM|nr:NADH-quinone oxidoreductase subunit C [Sporolituus thermophilus]SDF15297.1 Ni,Fe-hydrogenase III large subunit [Sporolituus thermophilus DSM 23256]
MLTYQEIQPGALRDTAVALLAGGAQLAAMFASDERPLSGSFAIYCLFANHARGEFTGIKVLLAEEPWEFPSLAPVTPAAAWYEREIHDLFGLTPVGHPDLRPLVLHENWPAGQYPLRKDFTLPAAVDDAGGEFPIPAVAGEGVFEVPVGPIHAGIIEPGHFRFSQAGENIIHLEAKLFYTHRGIEKAVEGLPVEDAFYRAERICGACSVSHAIAFSQAVETLAGVEVPPRAQYLRVLAAELERLYNHVGDIGNICAGVGFAVGISHGSRVKELIMRLNEALTGNRFLRGMVAPGGVRLDITADLAGAIINALQVITTDFQELVDILRENSAFLDRVNTTGVLPRQTALDLAVVGVAARASGVNVDMRRDFPYACYGKLNFKVPTYPQGDVAARIWVRADEIRQTASIIRQVLDGMPPRQGALKAALPPLPPYHAALGWSESPRGGNLHWLMVGEDSRIYRYFVRSASYPNWPAVALAAPGNIIPDFPLINKSFELCYACIDR